MEPLYEIFCHSPLGNVALFGAVLLAVIAFVIVFKFRMSRPSKKEK